MKTITPNSFTQVLLILFVVCFAANAVYGAPKGSKNKAKLFEPATAYTVHFDQTGKTSVTFIKIADSWLAIHPSKKSSETFVTTTIKHLCERRQSSKGSITEDGLFLEVNAPDEPKIDAKTGRATIQWNIQVTYENTGNSAKLKAKIFVNKKGALSCAHEDNR